MKQTAFEHQHRQQWQQLTDWLDALDKRNTPQKLSTFPQLYRQVCQHLALAQDRHYSSALTEQLNSLALRGHQHLYRTPNLIITPWLYFLSVQFPQCVRKEKYFIGLSGIFFGVALLVMFFGVQMQPTLINYFIEPNEVKMLESMYHPEATHLGRERGSESDFLMFGFYIYNNISIGFQTFASGLLLGLGSLFFLVVNGLYIGCVAGHLTYIGYSEPFFAFVAGHSALELTAIVFAGGAGLKLGWSLIRPGTLRRQHALRRAAIESIQLIYGVITMLGVAAFIEAFWSSKTSIAPEIKYSFGLVIWLMLLGYFFWIGRRATGTH
ncbi:MAG: stage II sporulation protein M [Pseudomonadota bacterium]|nr:stage II sporulation protein M [Pseudomonadota bacterium]